MPDEFRRRQVLKAGVGFVAGTGSTVLFNYFNAVLAQPRPRTVITPVPGATIRVNTTEINNSTPSNPSTQPLKFPRQQEWESRMCRALGMPENEVASTYAGLTPFQKIIGTMGLDAAEAYYQAIKRNSTPQLVIERMQSTLSSAQSSPFGAATSIPIEEVDLRHRLTGIVIDQIITKLKLNQNDADSIALRNWATPIYRQMSVEVAFGTLQEYYKWKNDPCTYSAPGYRKPQQCMVALNVNPVARAALVTKPPSELLLKAGLAYAAGNTGNIVTAITTGLSGIGVVGGFTTVTGALLAAELGSRASLFSAFGGNVAALSASGWLGVLAGPAAIIVAAIIAGTTQGTAVIESEQAEFKLKQAIAAAMGQNINMTNVVTEQNTSALFHIGATKSALNGWKAPGSRVDGEVTFFCEAGYVAKFYLDYTLNGQRKSFNTGDLSLGFWRTFPIPADAQNIEVRGVMLAAGEKQIFRETLQRPNFKSYKVYGTVFNPAWNNDWPISVSGEISSKAGQIKLTHAAGFVAKWQITYDLPGRPNQSWNSGDTGAGWQATLQIPLASTNVRILAQGATGLAWEWWRTTYDKTFASAPNLCLKIYGTSLAQKWNEDCN